ncbi:MAG: FAD-dependent oxidoreductase, partial [Rhodospirillales bacterium]|nr:FAD-dependent oxidoreductase [Rhodospirillales bacterium]
TKFIESEWSVPAANGPPCFAELRTLMRTRHPGIVMPIEYRTVAADDLPISPNHGRASVAISIHDFPDGDWRGFFTDARAVFRHHGGRPHGGKWHDLTAHDFRDLYPAFERFARVRAVFDPDGVFLTPALRAMFV